MKAIGLPFVCLAMFAVAGGHWAVFQTIAWSQMLWEYSQQEGSILAGAQKTFSGEAPCEMCKSIAAAKKQEDKVPAPIKADKKAELSLVVFDDLVPFPDMHDFRFLVFAELFWTRSEAPPVPVPIG